MIDQTQLYATLGRTGFRVYRLGMSASYRPGPEAVFRASKKTIQRERGADTRQGLVGHRRK